VRVGGFACRLQPQLGQKAALSVTALPHEGQKLITLKTPLLPNKRVWCASVGICLQGVERLTLEELHDWGDFLVFL
jgi:hypothetical protein